MDFIIAPAVVGIIAYTIYKLFQLFVCRKERMMWIQLMIQKIGEKKMESKEEENIEVNLPSLSMNSSGGGFPALRWGCLCAGLGLGIAFAFFISHWMNFVGATSVYGYEFESYYAPIYGASTLLFGGIGLIISYIIGWKSLKK